jgi:hypothetical protein
LRARAGERSARLLLFPDDEPMSLPRSDRTERRNA